MINLNTQVPAIYPSASRDFQYISWLINIVLNGVKHNVDDLYNLPNTKADNTLTELLAMTLGFKVKRNYDGAQLLALVNILPVIMRYKGTAYAVEVVGNALIKASGAVGRECECEFENNLIKVFLPKDLIDINLFTDILPYILPAGITCHISRKNLDSYDVTTELPYKDDIIWQLYQDLDWDSEYNTVAGPLAELFDVDTGNAMSFTNFDVTNKNKLNTGLLSNTVIPVLDRGYGLADPNKDTTPD